MHSQMSPSGGEISLSPGRPSSTLRGNIMLSVTSSLMEAKRQRGFCCGAGCGAGGDVQYLLGPLVDEIC